MITRYEPLPPEVTGLPSPLLMEAVIGGVPCLQFGGDVLCDAADGVRTADLRAVAREPGAVDTTNGGEPLYHVYRNVRPALLSESMERFGFSYALTTFKAGTIGGGAEWVRTRGHTNSDAPGTNLSYPEIHEVLRGEAWLYLQHGATEHPTDAVTIPLMAGDKAVVAPGWASLLVNVGVSELIVGTWRMADCETERTALAERGGMAHFVLRGGDGAPFCEANSRYKAVPEARTAAPKELPDWGLTRTESLLAAFHRSPEYLRCLLRPQDFADVWKSLYD